MRKNRQIEQSHDNHKERPRQKLESQLAMIEDTIKDLMDGVDVKALPLKERLLITTRFEDAHDDYLISLALCCEAVRNPPAPCFDSVWIPPAPLLYPGEGRY